MSWQIKLDDARNLHVASPCQGPGGAIIAWLQSERVLVPSTLNGPVMAQSIMRVYRDKERIGGSGKQGGILSGGSLHRRLLGS